MFNHGACGGYGNFRPADVGKVSGVYSGFGPFSGIIAPILVGYVLQSTNSFAIAYYMFAALAMMGGLLSFALVSKEKSIRQQKQEINNIAA